MRYDYVMSIEDLYKTNQTIFNMNDLALIWSLSEKTKVQDRARYYAKTGKLINLKRGLYALSKDYEYFELASKLSNPSYISLETVLAAEGLVFQSYETIFSVAFKNSSFQLEGRDYVFKQVKKSIISDTRGLVNKNNYWIADKERAFLDVLYLYKDYHFDNLLSINWDYAFELVELYENKAMLERLKEYKFNYA